MNDILTFIHVNAEMIRGSLRDPIFLICLTFAFLAALARSWLVGIAAVMLVAMVRVALTDWEHFSPGVPPSPDLIFVFSATLVAAVIILVMAKLLGVLLRNAGRLAPR